MQIQVKPGPEVQPGGGATSNASSGPILPKAVRPHIASKVIIESLDPAVELAAVDPKLSPEACGVLQRAADSGLKVKFTGFQEEGAGRLAVFRVFISEDKEGTYGGPFDREIGRPITIQHSRADYLQVRNARLAEEVQIHLDHPPIRIGLPLKGWFAAPIDFSTSPECWKAAQKAAAEGIRVRRRGTTTRGIAGGKRVFAEYAVVSGDDRTEEIKDSMTVAGGAFALTAERDALFKDALDRAVNAKLQRSLNPPSLNRFDISESSGYFTLSCHAGGAPEQLRDMIALLGEARALSFHEGRADKLRFRVMRIPQKTGIGHPIELTNEQFADPKTRYSLLLSGCRAELQRAKDGIDSVIVELPGTSRQFQAHVKAIVGALPSRIIEELKEKGFLLECRQYHNQEKDFEEEVTGSSPGGWPVGSRWDEIGGCYKSNIKTALVSEFRLGADQTTWTALDEGARRHVVRHEVGHAVDDIAGTLSDLPAFKAAWKKDYENLTPEDRTDPDKCAVGYFIQEGADKSFAMGRAEAFAEAFAILASPSAEHDYSTAFAKAFPNVITQARRILEERYGKNIFPAA